VNSFIKSFARLEDGSWLCIRPAEWDSPWGRIQVTQGARFTPGTTFMGVDLARVLDEAAAEQQHPVISARR